MVRNIVFLLFALISFSTLSCTKEKGETLPEIILGRDTVEISREGGSGTISYSIKNSSPEARIEALSEAEWIRDIDCSRDNIISFTVDENTGEEREAVIKITYLPQSATAEAVIVQSGEQGGGDDPDPDAPFEIEISGIEMESALCSFHPKDNEMTYITACLPKEVCDELGSDEAIYAEWVSNLWAVATDMGMNVSDFLNKYGLRSGDVRLKVNGLYPDTHYMVMAVGMDAATEQLSEIVKAEFTSLPVEMNGATFDMSYDFVGPSVTMNVSPSSDEIYYYYAPLKKADVEQMDMTLEESLKIFLDEEIAYGSMIGFSREEVMADLLYRGASSTEYAYLHASSDYIGVAVSVSLQGYLCSEMTISEFVTPAGEMSDNILGMKVSNVNADRFFLEITATNDDPYCMLVLATNDYPGLSPEECLEKLEGNAWLDSRTTNGNKSGLFTGLEPETEYYVMLFGYKNGMATTELLSETIVTTAEGNPEELRIEVEFSDITSNSLTAHIKPTPDNVLYFSTIIPDSYSKETVYDYIDYLVEYYMYWGMVKDKEDFFKKTSTRGEQVVPCTDLISGYKYKICAIGIYSDNGRFATDVLFSQSVKTAEREMSDVRITLDGDKYFDGDEVARDYPQYSSGKGMAVVPVRVKTEGDVKSCRYMLYYGDLSDVEKDPDGALIKDLARNGLTDPENIFYAEFGSTVTLVGVAEDMNGLYGNVYRRAFTLTLDGCSPIDEFVPLADNAPAYRFGEDFSFHKSYVENTSLIKESPAGNDSFFTYDEAHSVDFVTPSHEEEPESRSIWPEAGFSKMKRGDARVSRPFIIMTRNS